MNFLPIFHPHIERDVRSAMAYYEERSVGLGVRFKRVFYGTVDKILVFPEKQAVKVGHDLRTRLMRPFPYLIFYAVERDAVFLLSVQFAGLRPAALGAIAERRRFPS